jgi:hypothetical protein
MIELTMPMPMPHLFFGHGRNGYRVRRTTFGPRGNTTNLIMIVVQGRRQVPDETILVLAGRDMARIQTNNLDRHAKYGVCQKRFYVIRFSRMPLRGFLPWMFTYLLKENTAIAPPTVALDYERGSARARCCHEHQADVLEQPRRECMKHWQSHFQQELEKAWAVLF